MEKPAKKGKINHKKSFQSLAFTRSETDMT